MWKNARGNEGIGYDMIIGRYLMVQLGLKAKFGRQIMQLEKTVVPMNEPTNFICQPNLTKREVQELVM